MSISVVQVCTDVKFLSSSVGMVLRNAVLETRHGLAARLPCFCVADMVQMGAAACTAYSSVVIATSTWSCDSRSKCCLLCCRQVTATLVDNTEIDMECKRNRESRHL